MSDAFNSILEWVYGNSGSEAVCCAIACAAAMCFKKVRRWVFDMLSRKVRISMGQWQLGQTIHVISENDLKSQKSIQDNMAELRGIFGADRVTFWQFHNGTSFSMANPQFKASTSYESCDNSAEVESTHMDGVLVSTLTQVVCPVYGSCDDSKPYVTEVDVQLKKVHTHKVYRFDVDTMDTCVFTNLMKESGIKTVYATAVADTDNNPLGILTVQFSNHTGDKFDKSKYIEAMYDARDAVSHKLPRK